MRSTFPGSLCLLLLLGAFNVQARYQAIPTDAEPTGSRQPPACVVLLHGLWRTYRSMDRIATALRQAGYATISVDYPSRSRPIEELAMQAVPEGVRGCRGQGAARIDFVTHSMGGIVLRYYLVHETIPELGRVVMLSPPNQGSEVADALRHNALYERVNGPAGGQLGTGPDGMAARLGPVDFPLGIITGNERAPFDELLASRIPGENDGKVSVERAKVEGMADFLVLPATHTFIVNNEQAIGQVLYFLEHGRFRREAADTSGKP